MNRNSRSRLVAFAALMLALALAISGCVQIVQGPGQNTAAPAATFVPAPAQTDTPSPMPAATPEFEPVFSVPSGSAVKQFMQLGLCAQVTDAISLFGQPEAIYGASSYLYRAIAGADDTEAAAVYRFMKDGIGLECIVSTLDNRILKKQVSTPGAFPDLLDSVSEKLPQNADLNALGYQELLTALGVNPYLWMSFVAPNAKTDADRYEVCLWPDGDGQLVAIVQNGELLRCEYQPDNTVLDAAAVDGVTPRAPRYLESKPKNDNGAVSGYAAFKKFAALKLGQSEQDVRDKMGTPTSEEGGSLVYAFADAAFATGQVQFAFEIASGQLFAKSVVALPLGDAEVRGRYAPQMLPGMSLDDIEHFMGKPFTTDQGLDSAGETINAYTYAGAYASVSAQFQKGADICLASYMTVNDVEEETSTLYEEYVLPVTPGKPAKTRTPETPAPTPAQTTPQRPTPTPRITFRIPRISFKPIITPSPTPIIIY
ncbi:MAG: hypothetical protein AAGU74_06750 [Bacillota bacterium]